jgi:hypothetical protein
VDPPPPLETSGYSLLYSREFLKFVKMRLTDGGVLQHWIPIAMNNYDKISDMRAIVKTITEEFPYVKCRLSIEGWGIHITASMSPIPDFTAQELAAKLPQKANQDLLEWFNKDVNAQIIFELLLNTEVPASVLLEGWTKKEIVTDSHPYIEYFLLRDM